MNVQHGGLTFSLQLDAPLPKGGETIQLVDHLPKDMKKPGLKDVQKLIDQKVEAVWVQGRLMVLFGYSPADEDDRSDKAIVEAGFLAWEDSKDSDDGHRFACLDAKGRAKLVFAKGVSKEMAKKIANAFWGALFAEPSELDDYEGSLNIKGVKTPFGVRDGKPFYGAEEDDIPADAEGGDFELEPLEMDDEEDTWSGRFSDDDEEEDEDEDDDYFGRGDRFGDEDDDDDGDRFGDRY